MANYATADEAQAKYKALADIADATVTAYLTEAHATIVALAASHLASIAADSEGLIALEHIEMALAYEALTPRSVQNTASGLRTIDAGKREGDRARALLTAWIKNISGAAGGLHTEDISDAPTFTLKDPETWAIDPEGTT